jgi:hypothetical protein
MQKYDVNQHLIETLLAWVKSGEIAIPEIQRPFVWEPSKVRDLLDSLYQGFPVGYIIVWKNPDIRLKDGSLSEGKKILIDGQQRITALSAALAGQKVITQEYKQVRIRIAFNPQKTLFEVANPAIEKDKSWIPDIAPFMNSEISLLKLIKHYTAQNPDFDEEQLADVLERLGSVTKKEVGVIVLSADLDIETVTEIFIRINREGVPLSQADFAMSKIAANERYDGHSLRKAIDYFCHLAVAPEFFDHIESNDSEFAATDYFKSMKWIRQENDDLYDPSYNDMLRVAFLSQFNRGKLSDLVALLSGRNFETRRYEEEIASEAFERLKSGVFSFMNETNFKRFLMIIKDAGFINSSLVTALGPMNFAYALYLKLRAEKYPANEIESYVRRWYVFSLLTGRYSGQVETRFDQDIRQISEKGFGDYMTLMESSELGETFWDVRLTRDLTTSNSRHPALMVYLASQVKNNVRGFLSRDITVRSMLEHRGDVHHIYPKNFLKGKHNLPKSQYNQIANYAYAQQEINISIGDQSPEKYVETVMNQCETKKPVYGNITQLDDLKANLKEHCIPPEFLNGGLNEFDDFLSARRSMMASTLKKYYDRL